MLEKHLRRYFELQFHIVLPAWLIWKPIGVKGYKYICTPYFYFWRCLNEDLYFTLLHSYWVTRLVFSNCWRNILFLALHMNIYWISASFQKIMLSVGGKLCFRIFLLLHPKEEYFLHHYSSCRGIDQIFPLGCHLFLTSRGRLRILTKTLIQFYFQEVTLAKLYLVLALLFFPPTSFWISHSKKIYLSIYIYKNMTLCCLWVNSQPLSLESEIICDLSFPGEALLLYSSTDINCYHVTSVPNVWHFCISALQHLLL